MSTWNEVNCDGVMHGWNLVRPDVDVMSFSLDARFVKKTEFMQGNDVTEFLKWMKDVLDVDDGWNAFEAASAKFTKEDWSFDKGGPGMQLV